MAKKKAEAENRAPEQEQAVQETAAPAASGKSELTKAEKYDKRIKAKAAKNKKPNIFKRMWRKIKEVFGELKKVTWPTFGKTLGQTGVVLVVVLFFIVIIGLANWGLSALYNLLIGIGK